MSVVKKGNLSRKNAWYLVDHKVRVNYLLLRSKGKALASCTQDEMLACRIIYKESLKSTTLLFMVFSVTCVILSFTLM